MIRGLRWAAAAAFLLISQGWSDKVEAHYPLSIDGYGWGGWGGGVGGSTVYGDQARGMGMYLDGAGSFNQQTAVANSINANTAMQWNEYIWQSQQLANQRYHEKMVYDRKLNAKTATEAYNRLRNNPTQNDVFRGDALNIALQEVTSPKVYTKALAGAKAKFAGTKIREIPFSYAAAGISLSVDDLTQNSPPTLLSSPEFAADREALRAVRVKFRAQADNQEDIDPKLITEAKRLIKSMQKTLDDNAVKFKKGSPAFRDTSNFLKGLYGLVSMLASPAIDVLLSGVEKRPDTTVADLLGFMQAFNLRFGVAKTPGQRMIYTELFQILNNLRNEVVGEGLGFTADRGGRTPANATAVFSGMSYDHLDARSAPGAATVTPAPPAPQP